MLDLRQTPQYALYMQNIGWTVIWEEGVNYFIKQFPIIGSVVKIQRPNEIHYQDITAVCNKYHVVQVIIEPKDDFQEAVLKSLGFKRSNSPYLPSKTIHIDLTQPQERLLKNMHYKTRYNIKLAQKNGVEISTSNDIGAFAEFWQACAQKQRRMYLSQKKEITQMYKSFRDNAELLLAHYTKGQIELISQHNQHTFVQPELIAGILLIHTKDISYYMYAASNEEGKKYFAPTLLVWEALQRSRERGSKVFDFEGIYDERFPLPRWKGFSRFKKSFGGEEVVYPGTYTKNRLPL